MRRGGRENEHESLVCRISGVCHVAAAVGGLRAAKQAAWYRTWISSKGPFQKSVHSPDGTVANFVEASDTTPVERVSVQIVKCWLDPSGNTWLNAQGTILEGPHKDSAPKIQTLEKIDKTGAVAEE